MRSVEYYIHTDKLKIKWLNLTGNNRKWCLFDNKVFMV